MIDGMFILLGIAVILAAVAYMLDGVGEFIEIWYEAGE